MKRIALTLIASLFGPFCVAEPATAPAVRPATATTQPVVFSGMKVAIDRDATKTPEAAANERMYDAGRRSMENLRKVMVGSASRKVEKIADMLSITSTGDWLDAQITFPKEFSGSFRLELPDTAAVWGGTLSTYRTGIDMETRTLDCYAHITKDLDKLKPGYFASARIARKPI